MVPKYTAASSSSDTGVSGVTASRYGSGQMPDRWKHRIRDSSVSCILQIDPIQVLRGIRILWRDLDFAASSADQLDLVVVRPAWRVIRQACLLYCQGCIRLVIRILAFVVVIQGIRALRKRSASTCTLGI